MAKLGIYNVGKKRVFMVVVSFIRLMAVGQSKVTALGAYGVTNEAADRTSPDRGK
jgi:hypothetical protein